MTSSISERARQGRSGGQPVLTLEDLLDQLPAEASGRGRHFELFCAWWLRNDPRYRHQLRNVWLWDDWPDRDGPDTGIDLVAETHDGDVWAIQAKGYGLGTTVTKRGIDSFLAESSRPPFVYRLLITSAESLSTNALRTVERQERPVGLVLRADLAASPVVWPTSFSGLDSRTPETAKHPKPHQREALDDIIEGLAAADRGRLIMACGTGKTLVGLWTHEGLAARRTLVLLPSLALLGQSLREWTVTATTPFTYLAVCSDDTVSDHVVSHRSALGVPTTTSPDAIAAFLDGDGVRVIFSTYQSADRVADALQLTGESFDLLLADEAHRTAGPDGRSFSLCLDGSRLPAAKRLFMTATPRIYTRRVRESAHDDGVAVASMDDESLYGPALHRLGFAEAVQSQLLSDYRVVVIGVSSRQYRAWIDYRRLVTLDGESVTDARTLAGQVGLAKVMADYDLRRVITFHNRVANAARFAEDLPGVISWLAEDVRPEGVVWSGHVSGAMSAGQRYIRLKQLEQPPRPAERAVLANAQCLSEGVDVPALDGLAFIEPRRSQVDIVQAVGRVMRRSPGKTRGTILIPVFIDDRDQDAETTLASSDFEPVWSLVRALRAHDDALAEELDELRKQLGRTPTAVPSLPAKLVLDLPADVPLDFVSAISIQLVEQTSPSFHGWVGLLERYVEEFNTALVPSNATYAGARLGKWVGTQRVLFARGELSAERSRALEAVPGWLWDAREADWLEGLTHLQAFVAERGDALVPQRFVADGFLLGRWVASRRREYADGTLSPNRARQLESIRGWQWGVRAQTWQATFDALAAFASDAGHTDVPPEARSPDGVPLREWASRQRTARTAGRLSEERKAALESLPGWEWALRSSSAPRDYDRVAWNKWFQLLEEFAHETGLATPQQKGEFRGEPLGRWVSQQRDAYRRGQLDQERVDRLEALPGWAWSALEARWEANYLALKQYCDRTGTCVISPDVKDDELRRLRKWADNQRRTERQGTMRTDRRLRLGALPGWWWFGDVGRGRRVTTT